MGARLVEQRECNLGVNVPVPLSERIETLAEVLYQEGHGRVSRKEIVASLLLAATEDPAELAGLVTRYRSARVRETLVGTPPAANVVRFPKRAPGPRARAR